MKHTLALLASVLIIGLVSTAKAQTDTSTLISFRDGSASGVVSSPVKSFSYQKIDFNVSPFAGFTFDQTKPTGGLMFGPTFKGWTAGLYGRWVQGKPVDAGVFVGFAWRS